MLHQSVFKVPKKLIGDRVVTAVRRLIWRRGNPSGCGLSGILASAQAALSDQAGRLSPLRRRRRRD